MPATTMGVFILVPGAMALRSLNALVSADAATGLQLTAAVLMVAVSLGAGVFVASLVVTPREARVRQYLVSICSSKTAVR